MIPRDWDGSPAVVIASGPSLTQDDVDFCRGRARVVAVNDCWWLAPWADALYAADFYWWQHHGGVPDFAGEKWCGDREAHRVYGIPLANTTRMPAGYSFDPETLGRLGGNSGGQAVNLAILRGADPVVMLGFDMQATGGRKHWFGDHPGRLNRRQHFGEWVAAMDGGYRTLVARGIRVINASRETALKAYPRMTIQEALS